MICFGKSSVLTVQSVSAQWEMLQKEFPLNSAVSWGVQEAHLERTVAQQATSVMRTSGLGKGRCGMHGSWQGTRKLGTEVAIPAQKAHVEQIQTQPQPK